MAICFESRHEMLTPWIIRTKIGSEVGPFSGDPSEIPSEESIFDMSNIVVVALGHGISETLTTPYISYIPVIGWPAWIPIIPIIHTSSTFVPSIVRLELDFSESNVRLTTS